MASYTRVVFSGSTDTINLTFPYLSREHVTVKLGGVLVPSSGYTWLSNSQIKLLAGNPSAGTVGEARRITPTAALVTYSPGNLDAGDLNISTLQPLYISEERADVLGDLTFSAWLTANQQAGGSITKGTDGQMLLFDASGNIVPGPKGDQIALAQAYAEAAAASAAAAATWDPANYINKTGNQQITGDLALKSTGTGDHTTYTMKRADGTTLGALDGDPDTGTVVVYAANSAGTGAVSTLELGGTSASLKFNSNTVWHAGNFTPSDYVSKVGGDVTLTGVLKAKSITVGEGQTASQIDMKDTNGLNRSILNDANVIGFLSSSGAWALQVADNGAIWTAQLGDVNTRIDARAASYASSAANDRVANLSYRLVNGGETAGTSAPSGAVMTGQRTVTTGGQNGTSTLYTAYAYPQVYDVVRGWVAFYSV